MMIARLAAWTRFIAVFGLVWGVTDDTSAHAASAQATREQLDRLRSKMLQIGAELRRDTGQRDRVRAGLEELEREIATLQRELGDTERAAAAKRAAVEALAAKYRAQTARLGEQQGELGTLIDTQYRMGRRDFVKMFLNQEDPARLGRALAYYRYVALARSARIRAIGADLRAIEALKVRVQREQQELNALSTAQQKQQAALTERQRQRRAVLTSLEQRIGTHQTELEALKRDETRLERLIEEIRAAVREVPPDAPASVSFQQMRGRLALPVNARIRARFGEPRAGAGRWRGVFLEAQEGQEVRAIFDGRVAFADWLRGFGLLLILDHGSGYMSLYSHNQDLRKQVGDWVTTGEVIARAGTSGGLRSSGLYFEIRHNGEPQNPLLWCTAPPAVATGGN